MKKISLTLALLVFCMALGFGITPELSADPCADGTLNAHLRIEIPYAGMDKKWIGDDIQVILTKEGERMLFVPRNYRSSKKVEPGEKLVAEIILSADNADGLSINVRDKDFTIPNVIEGLYYLTGGTHFDPMASGTIYYDPETPTLQKFPISSPGMDGLNVLVSVDSTDQCLDKYGNAVVNYSVVAAQ